MADKAYDIEFGLSEAIAEYLDDVLPNDEDELFAKCPTVSYFDPMAQGEEDRVIVLADTAETMAESPGNMGVEVEITQKSRWRKPKLAEDYKKHRQRTRELRDKVFSPTLAGDFTAFGTGFAVDFVGTSKKLETDAREGWLYSSIRFTVKARVAA